MTIVVAFFVISGLFLWVFPDTSYFSFGYATSELFFTVAYYLMLFVIPVLTVSFFSGEYRYGTFETLSMIPQSWGSIVTAKFLAGMFVVLLIILISIPSMSVIGDIALSGDMDRGQIIGSYFGLLLIGACFVALSVATSTFFENSSVAFLIAIVIGFVCYGGLGFIANMRIWSPDMKYAIESMGWEYHGDYLSRGVLPLRTIMYLLLWITGLLTLAIWNLKRRNF